MEGKLKNTYEDKEKITLCLDNCIKKGTFIMNVLKYNYCP